MARRFGAKEAKEKTSKRRRGTPSTDEDLDETKGEFDMTLEMPEKTGRPAGTERRLMSRMHPEDLEKRLKAKRQHNNLERHLGAETPEVRKRRRIRKKKVTSVVEKVGETTKDKNEDIDLFGSDEEEDDKAREIREKRLADYAAKKAKKPGPIAKSTVIFNVKPCDKVDMAELEKQVRGIEMDGLVWGSAKLEIKCVIPSGKVSNNFTQLCVQSSSMELMKQIANLKGIVQTASIMSVRDV